MNLTTNEMFNYKRYNYLKNARGEVFVHVLLNLDLSEKDQFYQTKDSKAAKKEKRKVDVSSLPRRKTLEWRVFIVPKCFWCSLDRLAYRTQENKEK